MPFILSFFVLEDLGFFFLVISNICNVLSSTKRRRDLSNWQSIVWYPVFEYMIISFQEKKFWVPSIRPCRLFMTWLTFVVLNSVLSQSRVREEDTSYRNEMLPKTFGHLLQGSCYEWRSEEHYQYQACYWAVWRPYHHCKKTQIEMVWAHNKINKTCKDDLRYKEGEGKADRKTDKKMGR